MSKFDEKVNEILNEIGPAIAGVIGKGIAGGLARGVAGVAARGAAGVAARGAATGGRVGASKLTTAATIGAKVGGGSGGEATSADNTSGDTSVSPGVVTTTQANAAPDVNKIANDLTSVTDPNKVKDILKNTLG